MHSFIHSFIHWLVQRPVVRLHVRDAAEDGSVWQYLGHDERLQRVECVSHCAVRHSGSETSGVAS